MIFNEYLYKYGLHDCEIDKISIDDNSILLTFNSGVYILDGNRKETIKTSTCKLHIILALKNTELLEQCVVINLIHRNKIKEVELNEFFNIISNSKLNIENNYYSSFNDSIMIEGYFGQINYQLKIERISKIIFDFN